jgi:hypothetical protein
VDILHFKDNIVLWTHKYCTTSEIRDISVGIFMKPDSDLKLEYYVRTTTGEWFKEGF